MVPTDIYLKKILKLLQCSWKKKQEVRKQLLARIVEEMEAGEMETDVIRRMGKPEEVAAELNAGFSPEEKKKYKRALLIKRICIGLVAAAVVAGVIAGILHWIFPKTTTVEEGSGAFERAAVEAQAEHVIWLLDQGEYASVQQSADESVKDSLSPERLSGAKQSLSADWGSRRTMGEMEIKEITEKGQSRAIVQVTAQYDHVTVTYTVTFDEAMRLLELKLDGAD